MSRNATSSWSGYSHQGMIGLLIALRKLTELAGQGIDLNRYKIEYERQEDIALHEDNAVIQVHQVKAKRTATTKGPYTPALINFAACAGLNYLHTICEVTDWDELLPAANPSNVLLYPYSQAQLFCPLDEMETMIDGAIFTYLHTIGHVQCNNEAWRKQAKDEFLGLLDDKIRYEHHHHTQAQYNITFLLSEIEQIMVNAPTRNRSKIWEIRKKIFATFLEYLDDMDNAVIDISPAHETVVTHFISKIYGLSDEQLIKFLCNINPHTSGREQFKHCETTDGFFVKAHFYDTFLHTIIHITQTSAALDRSAIPYYNKNKHYLITAIQSVDYTKAKFSMEILKNPHIDFSSYENDLIINQNFDGFLSEAANKFMQKDPRNFTSKNNLKFIKIVDAINELNN